MTSQEEVDYSVDFVAQIAPHPTLGKREQTKARNRAVILAAARKVFARLGFEGATVRDIVRATGLAVGTFYEYYRDKQAIAGAIAEEAWAELRRRLRVIRRDRSVPLEDRVHRAYLAYFRFVQEERELHDVLDHLFWSPLGRARNGPVGLAVEELREDLLPDWATGAIGSDDPQVMAAAMVGTGILVTRQLIDRGGFDPEEAARFCARFVLHGVVPRSTPASTSKPHNRRRTA